MKDGLLVQVISDPKPINDAVQATSETLRDYVYDRYLSVVTPWVFKDLEKYYGLSEDEIVQTFERFSEQPLDEVTVKDKLVEQAFVTLQVDYIRKILTHTLSIL